MESDKELRDLQLRELKIMKTFANICKTNGLRFYLMGGTFLGAVRHKGFIPWDDDIDLGMPREDYDRMAKIIDGLLPDGYVFRNFEKGNETTIYFSRIEDLNYEIKDNSALVKRQRYAWIDIFPLDGMPENAALRFIHKFVLLYRRLALQYSNYSTVVNQDLPGRPFHEKLLIDLGRIIPFEKVFDTKKCLYKLDKSLRRYPYVGSEYVVNFMGAYKFKEMFPKNIYDEISFYPFEDGAYAAPKDYDLVLSQMYGDYMKVPKKKDRYKHHIEVKE